MKRWSLPLLFALVGLLALAPPALARKPIISYLDAGGTFQLHDAETGANLSPPPVPVPAGGAAQFRWGMSLDGRYIVFKDAGNKLHLLDRSNNQQVPLPGIDKVANPANLTVGNTGLIGFDDAANPPTYVYDSLAKSFFNTGLDADPGNPANDYRQPRLSGDGNFMVNTCVENAMSDCDTTNDDDSDVFLRNLASKQQVGNFPDQADGDGVDEERPCINNDGALIAVSTPNTMQRDIFLFQRNGNAFAPVATPNLNDPANEDNFCQLSPGGGYVSLLQNNVYRLYERSSSSFVSLTNFPFDERSTLSSPYTPPLPSALMCAGKDATEVGTAGRDLIKGTKKRDVIAALGGNDVVRSLGGNDLVCGDAGKDKLFGGKGRDLLRGDAGRDKLFGGKGKDTIKGGKGKDKLVGGPDKDKLNGGPGRDQQSQQ